VHFSSLLRDAIVLIHQLSMHKEHYVSQGGLCGVRNERFNYSFPGVRKQTITTSPQSLNKNIKTHIKQQIKIKPQRNIYNISILATQKIDNG
jgi:hypothetical protein